MDPPANSDSWFPDAMVAAHPRAATGLIILLMVVIFYHYAASQGWLDFFTKTEPLVARSSKKAGTGARGGKSKKAPPPEDEVDELIDIINS
jgi:hypothetical protein